MGKYTPLGEFLRAQTTVEVWLSFSDIEAILGTALPPRAQHQRSWWSNNAANNVMTAAWLDAGYRTERVDLNGRRLVFRRVDLRYAPEAAWRDGDPIPLVNGRHPILGALKDITFLVPGVDLTEPADPDWADIADQKTL